MNSSGIGVRCALRAATSVTITFSLFALSLSQAQLHAQQPADIVLRNGKILTVDEGFSIAQAVAITGNKFAAVGQDADVMKQAGPNTQVIDLKGRTVIPGLIDTHLHITGPGVYAEDLTPDATRTMSIDWRGVNSKDDVLNQIRNLMEKYHFKPGEWLYFQNRLEFSMGDGGRVDSSSRAKILYDDLNAKELDKVVPNNPIVLTLGIPDENGLLINSKALEVALQNTCATWHRVRLFHMEIRSRIRLSFQ